MEEWRAVFINNIMTSYEISNKGNVRHSSTKKYRKVTIENTGYQVLTLYFKGKRIRCRVHRLVADAFIPNPDNLPCVNHKDENKHNNCVENLEWCTYSYNNNYGTKGVRISNTLKEYYKTHEPSFKGCVHTNEARQKMSKIHKGKVISDEQKSKMAKSVIGVDIQTFQIKYYKFRQDVCKDNFDPSAVGRVCKGIYKQHKGYKWFYTTDLLELMNYIYSEVI